MKEIEAQLSAQRARLEQMLLTDRAIPYAQWQERYLKQPLLHSMVSRLIWQFGEGKAALPAVPRDGRLVDSRNRPIKRVRDDAAVRLWHPLGQLRSLVASWRRWLLQHEVAQPFKQADREIYVLDALPGPGSPLDAPLVDRFPFADQLVVQGANRIPEDLRLGEQADAEARGRDAQEGSAEARHHVAAAA